MNIYRYQFDAVCPNDGETIRYSLEIKARHIVQAEHIGAACVFAEPIFHEQAADKLHEALGGEQSLTATHCGVHIETLRGTYGKREARGKVTDEQVAYAALWRCYTDNPVVHEARMILLAKIGGQGSDAQRQALEWIATVRPEEEPYDNGYPDDETPAHIVEELP